MNGEKSLLVFAIIFGVASSACTFEGADEPARGGSAGSAGSAERAEQTPSERGGKSSATPSNVPTALLGRWFQGNLAATQLYDDVTGQWAPTQGTGIFYIFEPDGTYRHGGIMNTAAGVCTSQLIVDERGTVSANEVAMTLSRKSGRSHVENACGPEADRALEPEEKLFAWRIVREGKKEKLVLVWPDQATDSFERWTE